METHAFASLAHVRILLIPVGLIPKAAYDSYAAEIRSFTTLKLAEIPAETRDGKATRFLPNPSSAGHLHISFPTHPPPQTHAPLVLVRPSHFPLAVIGISTCSQAGSLSRQFNSTLTDLFPPGSQCPLVRNCFVFEESEGNVDLEPGDNLTLVPRIANRRLHLGTLLGVICSQILVEFGLLVQALETPIGNEYLNAALMPSLPPLSELPSPISHSGPDTPSPFPSHSSQPEISRSSLTLNTAPTLRRNVSIAAAATRQQTLTVLSQKKRLNTIGTSSSPGRLYKMLGDLFLLAGRSEDALIWYTEAAQVFRNSNDILWHACTLEGMTTASVVDAWSAGQGLNASAAPAKEPWNDLNEKLQQAIGLYQRITPADSEPVHSLLSFLCCSSVLRQASLLFSVWSAKGWGPLAFTTMLQPGPKPYVPPTLATNDRHDWLSLERLTMLTGIPRSTISTALGQLHGPWLLHLGQRERIAVLEAMASLYACLGYQRKEAYILREVLGCLLDLMVCGREEDGHTQMPSIPQSAGLGVHNVHSMTGTNLGTVGVRLSESTAGNESLLALLAHVCRVLGINLEALGLSESAECVVEQPPSLNDHDEDIIEALREPVGWPELQVGVVREAVAIAEALPGMILNHLDPILSSVSATDFPTVAQYSLSALKTLQTILAPGDQYHLYTTATRALLTARRRGDSRSIEYWSGRPIISISVVPLPSIRLPIEKPRSMQLKARSSSPILPGLVDPFLYNPRKAMNRGQTCVVQNEILEFVITLQNPYIFDLELQHLSLSASGVPFESRPMRVIIPANTLHQVVISGKATQAGTLTVRGCFVQAPGGITREYILPMYTNEEEERLARKRRAILSESGRFKYSGLECYPCTKALNTHSGEVPLESAFKFLECKVVPEQPLLRIRRTSITHGALMLYDGEKSNIRITLENVSTIPIDFVHFAFEDSTIEPAQKAFQEGDLSVFETYETEYSLIHQPVFSRQQQEAQTILPNQNLTLTVGCFGKVGCTNGTIHISYARSRDPELEESDVFHVRQISYPLMVTVYHMLECTGMDILPFPAYPHVHRDKPKDEWLQYLAISEDCGWCLFSIEIRNSYGTPFDVTLLRSQSGESTASSTTTIPPGAVSRLVIPIRKIALEEGTTNRPIPTLSEKQFVVTTSSLSTSEENAQRELFWYREELFECVCAQWYETSGTRSGELSFRGQRMTLPMLETLRLEIARISLRLEPGDDDHLGKNTFAGVGQCAKANEFVQLTARVTNLTTSALVFTLDFEAAPTEFLVHDGVLTDLPLGCLKSGESEDISTTLCFLACGRFEVSAQVRIIGDLEAEGRVARAYIIVIVTDDKHIVSEVCKQEVCSEM